ncbi:TlpA family protein disulfide reductase [Sphingobacterium hotanense]|uniref:TlpA family protein disulfide reductase n=1 Tax=Sphingobacterium hotanense TaxID=649196 RepID=UPI0021A25CFF|nr:thioredoxin domain-containing protein [Sphingobacterium hotanense]MCT1526840.1 thioredoxin domain-containing protein [Sphingobacterium hotanense]
MFSYTRAQSSENRGTDVGLTDIKPLQIDDTIPDELWHLPLQVVNHPAGKDTITLNDYRGKKLIILDFWATWCGSCISAFPKVKSTENRFKEDLVVIPMTNQNGQTALPFLTTNESIKDLNIWSAVNAKKLEEYFEIHTLPHYVWLSNGKLISFTTANALEESRMSGFLNEGKISWKEKIHLNKKEPFIHSFRQKDFTVNSFHYKGKLEGVGKSRGTLPYSKQHKNYYFTNFTQRDVLEWFEKKLTADFPNKYVEVKIAQSLFEPSELKDFLCLPVSSQIIIHSERSTEEVFYHWLNLNGLQVSFSKDNTLIC